MPKITFTKEYHKMKKAEVKDFIDKTFNKKIMPNSAGLVNGFTWTSDTEGKAEGKVTGTVKILEDRINVEINVPLVLSALIPMIKKGLEHELNKLT